MKEEKKNFLIPYFQTRIYDSLKTAESFDQKKKKQSPKLIGDFVFENITTFHTKLYFELKSGCPRQRNQDRTTFYLRNNFARRRIEREIDRDLPPNLKVSRLARGFTFAKDIYNS